MYQCLTLNNGLQVSKQFMPESKTERRQRGRKMERRNDRTKKETNKQARTQGGGFVGCERTPL